MLSDAKLCSVMETPVVSWVAGALSATGLVSR
jgi:hypothetical protein